MTENPNKSCGIEQYQEDDNIKVTITDVKNGQIKLGITAPKDVTVNREEVVKEIKGGNVLSSASGVIIKSKNR